jgi:hypothetical protein
MSVRTPRGPARPFAEGPAGEAPPDALARPPPPGVSPAVNRRGARPLGARDRRRVRPRHALAAGRRAAARVPRAGAGGRRRAAAASGGRGRRGGGGGAHRAGGPAEARAGEGEGARAEQWGAHALWAAGCVHPPLRGVYTHRCGFAFKCQRPPGRPTSQPLCNRRCPITRPPRARREGGWAGVAFSRSSASALAAARGCARDFAVYDGAARVRTLHTVTQPYALTWLPEGHGLSVLALAEMHVVRRVRVHAFTLRRRQGPLLLKPLRVLSRCTACSHHAIVAQVSLPPSHLQVSIWDVRAGERGGCMQRVSACPPGSPLYALDWCSAQGGLLGAAGAERAVQMIDPRRWGHARLRMSRAVCTFQCSSRACEAAGQ